jgi:hypothetical protein
VVSFADEVPLEVDERFGIIVVVSVVEDRGDGNFTMFCTHVGTSETAIVGHDPRQYNVGITGVHSMLEP